MPTDFTDNLAGNLTSTLLLNNIAKKSSNYLMHIFLLNEAYIFYPKVVHK
jgi:hypothetical protein